MRIRIIICIIMAFLSCHVLKAQSTTFRALLVGIADYPGTEDDIDPPNTYNDATDMRVYLMTYQGWSSNNIELKQNSNATESDILNYISSMPNTTGTSELFFYSGHGSESEDGAATYSGVINANDLLTAFGPTYNQFCCIFNSCHSGYFKHNMPRGEILTSSMEVEYSYANGPDNNSVFSYYVLEGLKNNQADPTPGHVVSAKELYDYAAPKAQEYAWSHFSSNMHPQYEGNLGVFNFQDLKTTSGTLIDDELWDHDITITGDVSIPSGINLVIKSGVTINLNGHSIIADSDQIVDEGATFTNLAAILLGPWYPEEGRKTIALCSTIAAAVSNSYYACQINIEPGTYNENISVSGKGALTIWGNGAYINGNVTISNSANCYLSDFSSRQLSIISSNGPIIDNVELIPTENIDESFTVLNSANCDIRYLQISNTYEYNGTYIYNSDGTIQYSNFSNLDNALIFNDCSYYEIYNNTEFCGNYSYDIRGWGNTWVDTYGCKFSRLPPPTTAGTVYNYNYSVCSLSKTNSIAENLENIQSEPVSEELEKIRTIFKELREKIRIEKGEDRNFDKSIFTVEFNKLINECKSYITSEGANVTSESVTTALNLAVSSYKQFEDYEGMKSFLQEVINDKKLKSMHGKAKRKLMDYYTYNKDYKTVLSTADEILNEAGGLDNKKADEDLICDVLLSKGLTYQYSTDNIEEAVKIYEEMLKNYPGNTVSELAKKQLKKLGKAVKEEMPKTADTESETGDFSADNYPNPFNPTTTISYTLPAEGRVQIKVFDILGREVETLVDNVIAAGKHKVEWNGSNWSSGIYFYSVTFKNQILYKKMLMIK